MLACVRELDKVVGGAIGSGLVNLPVQGMLLGKLLLSCLRSLSLGL